MSKPTKPSHQQQTKRGKMPATHTTAEAASDRDSKLYRVRDRHDGDYPGHVWGHSLSWDEANKLKGAVIGVGPGKSRTARVEDMDVPMPEGRSAAQGGSPRKNDNAQHPSRPRYPAKVDQKASESAKPAPVPIPRPPEASGALSEAGKYADAANRRQAEREKRQKEEEAFQKRQAELLKMQENMGPEEPDDEDEYIGSDIDDLAGDAGSLPDAASIAKAEARAAKEASEENSAG